MMPQSFPSPPANHPPQAPWSGFRGWLEIDRPRVLEWLVYTIVIMNAADAIMTVFWVSAGLATESNPLMDWLLDVHPVLFVLAKLALVFLGVGMLWRYRHIRAAMVGVALVAVVYYGVILVHATGIGLVVAWLMV
ncbi:MAG: DUF5658 family protein [Myxococcota bacterium]